MFGGLKEIENKAVR